MFQGKAGSLIFLRSLGLRVPEFHVLTHQNIVAQGDPQKYDEFLHALKTGLAIEARAQDFADSVKLDLSSEDRIWAVRSSGSLEDSQSDSFAGIFETKLFVKDLALAVKEVWSSLYSEKARAYLKERGLLDRELKMDVIIQEMINGDKSGVLFQANPTGLVTEQVIEAGYGLGQGIVDDRTDTDRYLIEGVEIREAVIRDKERFLTFEGDSLREAQVPAELRCVSVLTQGEIESLLTASTILSTHVDVFLDLEFTFKRGELFLLQARPITTLAPKRDTIIFDNSNIAENYPGVSLPLTYSSLSRGYSTNFKNLLRFVGLRDKDWQYLQTHLDALTGYWGGQIYYNLNNWYAVYTLLPFGAEGAVKSFNDMVGIKDQGIVKVPARTLLTKLGLLLRILPRSLSFIFRGGSYHRDYTRRFQDLYRRNSGPPEGPIFGLLRRFTELESEYYSMICVPLFNDFYSSLLNRACRRLAARLHPEGEGFYNDLLGHQEDLESARAITSLLELADLARNNTERQTALEQGQVPADEEFRTLLAAHFERYGDRSQWEMKIETPTAREAPAVTLRLILEYAKNSLDRKEQRVRDTEKGLKAKGQLNAGGLRSPFSWLAFRLLFNPCVRSIAFREAARFDRVRFKGLSRKLLLNLGEKLVSAGVLEQNEDLFYLSFEELRSLTHDSFGANYWKDLVALRKRHLKANRDLRLPDRIIINSLTGVEKLAQSQVPKSSSAYAGIPCSGGITEAECVIVTDLTSAPSLSGKILVAERTDPSWGYFFVGVKGIIIEKGSMLSHAAIISRELGIPCVINVKDATRSLKTGMRLRLDGNRGTVTCLDPLPIAGS